MYSDKGIKAVVAILILTFVVVIAPAFYSKKENFAYVTINANKIAYYSHKTASRKLFIGGAVIKEGYYDVTADMTYKDLFILAGLYQNADMSALDMDRYIDFSQDNCILNFIDILTQEKCVSVNINHASLIDFLQADIDYDVSQKIIAYRLLYGKFKDKQDLLKVVTPDELSQIQYKVYVI